MSTVKGLRWRNTPRLAAYMDAVAAGERPARESEPLSDETVMRERLMLGLRLDEPVRLADVRGAIDEQALARLERLELVETVGSVHAADVAWAAPGRWSHCRVACLH